MLQLKRENPYCSLTPLGIYTPYPGTELYDRCRNDFGVEFPDSLEGWSEYQWQKNNNVFLQGAERKLLTRLNVASRFFDEKLFERFGEKRLKHLIMALYHLYGSLIRLRVRRRFFRFMPEVAVLNTAPGLLHRLHPQKVSEVAWRRACSRRRAVCSYLAGLSPAGTGAYG